MALSKPALATVSELAKTRISEFVFPGQKLGRPLSNMAMLMLLEPMGKAKGDNLARVPIDVFGLGFGSQPVLVGASRKRSCAYDRQQSRGRIPPRRCPRKASGDDGGLGAMVRAEGGERRRICSTRRNRVRTFVLPATLIDLVSRGTFDRTKPQLSEARLRE